MQPSKTRIVRRLHRRIAKLPYAICHISYFIFHISYFIWHMTSTTKYFPYCLRQMQDAPLQSRHSRLCAVADIETVENDVDVPFDRCFADAESFADLPVAAALDDQFQHFQFARAQLLMRRPFRQTLGYRGWNVLQA